MKTINPVVSFSVTPKTHAKLRKLAFKSGVSIAGISRMVMDEFLGTHTDIANYPPHIKRERVISDVTIRIQKGIRVKIV